MLSKQPLVRTNNFHSNLVKKGAEGGYVITTGSFTSFARVYAEGLTIELTNVDVYSLYIVAFLSLIQIIY